MGGRHLYRNKSLSPFTPTLPSLSDSSHPSSESCLSIPPFPLPSAPLASTSPPTIPLPAPPSIPTASSTLSIPTIPIASLPPPPVAERFFEEEPSGSSSALASVGGPDTTDEIPDKVQGPLRRLGACVLSHVPFGVFIAGLCVGDPVEALSDGRWSAQCVRGVRYDGSILRYIKVNISLFSPLINLDVTYTISFICLLSSYFLSPSPLFATSRDRDPRNPPWRHSLLLSLFSHIF